MKQPELQRFHGGGDHCDHRHEGDGHGGHRVRHSDGHRHEDGDRHGGHEDCDHEARQRVVQGPKPPQQVVPEPKLRRVDLKGYLQP